MKTRPSTARTFETDRVWKVADADVSAQIKALFGRCPDLCGFSVQAKICAEGNPVDEEELFVTAIGIALPTSKQQYADIFEQIATTLKDLLAERPEAHALLRGRTFARVLQ
jgi:hypothetical protein